MHLALPDLLHHRVHIGVVPDLGELAVFEAIKVNSEIVTRRPVASIPWKAPRWVPVTVKCTAI